MGCFYATCGVFIFGGLGLVARLHGFSILQFVRYIGDELLIVLRNLVVGIGVAENDRQAGDESAPVNRWWAW